MKHTYCTGCPIDLDISNPALNEFVEQALIAIDDGSIGRLMHKAIRIVKAQKQVNLFCLILKQNSCEELRKQYRSYRIYGFKKDS